MTQPLATESQDEQRRAWRAGVKMHAQLRDRISPRFSVDICDLSTTGFRAQTAHRFERGERVWLTLPGLSPLEASIAWSSDLEVGCAFVQPLHAAVFDHILRLAA